MLLKHLKLRKKQEDVKKDLEKLDKKVPEGGACTVAPYEKADPPQVKKDEPN